MKKIRRIGILLIFICMILVTRITSMMAKAEELTTSPDYTQKGSITVDVISTDTGKAIPGGTLTLYEVADARQVDGENILELTSSFKESGIALTEVSESDAGMKDLASKLETYVKNHNITGKAVTADEKGQASWSNLRLGLYLVLHTTPAKGYDPMHAFLVTVPRYLDGAYVYQVKANPKAGTANTSIEKTPEPTPTPAVSGGKLPQTGQLWWPVPVLVFAGILFVLVGWYRRRCCEKKNSEC